MKKIYPGIGEIPSTLIQDLNREDFDVSSVIVCSNGSSDDNIKGQRYEMLSNNNLIAVSGLLRVLQGVDWDVPLSYCGENIDKQNLEIFAKVLQISVLELPYTSEDHGEEIGMCSFFDDPNNLVIRTWDGNNQIFRFKLSENNNVISENYEEVPLTKKDITKILNVYGVRIPTKLFDHLSLGGRNKKKNKSTPEPNLLFQDHPEVLSFKKILEEFKNGNIVKIRGIRGDEVVAINTLIEAMTNEYY